jgi:hypothetical protein
MVDERALSPEDRRLLAELRTAVRSAPSRPTGIEVGIALSITLGRMRPSVACGGCSSPLEFEGIPAETNAKVRTFRLRYDPIPPRERATAT